MSKNTQHSIEAIKVSPQFRSKVKSTIIALIFFAICYLILLVAAIALTMVCIYYGVMIVVSYPRLIAIAAGIGIASMGILILIFLIKFIFKSNKVDRSHLIEIHRKDEPQLFSMLDELVKDIGTEFPKKVYLSPEVNAYVFYDSSFWSMFFPIKKNLAIGMGLVNTNTVSELKAILSHEFGHFSQRSMKVGSYVYNVNQVIYNMLYDNDSIDNISQGLSKLSGVIALCVVGAIKIIEGIQWILQQLYKLVNRSYMALSREMEFHADEIAAHITGFLPLKTALLRMELADQSYDSVIEYYNSKIDDCMSSENIYRDHGFALQFKAEKNKLAASNYLPNVTIEDLKKNNKSKLNVEDQWASHPTMEQRVRRLEATEIVKEEIDNRPASVIFSDIDQICQKLTAHIFREVKYPKAPQTISFDEFKSDFQKDQVKFTFPEIYNGYYDDKKDINIDLEDTTNDVRVLKASDLFSDEMVDLIYTKIGLDADIESLKDISQSKVKVKSFDYDGIKYSRKDAKQLIRNIEPELNQIKAMIEENDRSIYKLFAHLEEEKSQQPKLKTLYEEYMNLDTEIEAKVELINSIYGHLEFLNQTTPFEQIQGNFISFREKEKKLKQEIKTLLEYPDLSHEIDKGMRDNFELFLSGNWEYFAKQSFLEANLNMLFKAISDYAYLIGRIYFIKKRNLLSYQSGLLEKA